MPDNFLSYIQRFDARAVAGALGSPLTTVQCWQRGIRTPPDWHQRMIKEKLGDAPAPGAVVRRGRGRPRKEGCAVPVPAVDAVADASGQAGA